MVGSAVVVRSGSERRATNLSLSRTTFARNNYALVEVTVSKVPKSFFRQRINMRRELIHKAATISIDNVVPIDVQHLERVDGN